jgi:hypothetical protein
MARDSIEPPRTMKMASKAVFSEKREEKILECVHENVSPEGSGARVSMW